MKHGYMYLSLVLFQSFYIDTSQYIKNIALQIKSCKLIKFGNADANEKQLQLNRAIVTRMLNIVNNFLSIVRASASEFRA